VKPYYEADGITLYHGRAEDYMGRLPKVDAIVTDPPYLIQRQGKGVPIGGPGVAVRRGELREAVGMPWGFSLDWLGMATPAHWLVFATLPMLAPLLAALSERAKLSALFTWRKSNAPQMVRPVPRYDCEYIVWARVESAGCRSMGRFKSLVVDIPMLQAGCFASERYVDRLGRAVHPTQKPLDLMRLFLFNLQPTVVLDPFVGTGTTLVAAKQLGIPAIGIEQEERYCEIAATRLSQGVLDFGGVA